MAKGMDQSTSSKQADALNESVEGMAKGTKVWVRGVAGQAAWASGELRSVEDGNVQVALDSSGKVVKAALHDVVASNPKLQEGISDLTNLSYLNEPGILFNLNFRYGVESIYTFAGPVLIAVNPCKALPLYTNEVANAYKSGARDVTRASRMDPHIYLVAANAFRSMLREKTSQSLVINGESGAGKTETTKKAMQYFATLAGGSGVEDQVLETNPILEAFGNAKTLRNHNSSRFGKLIQIHFNQGNHICGAAIKTYLLEKSRVVHQLQGERSYHVFYQLVRGATPEQKANWKLPDHPKGFKYLSTSGCTEIAGVDDAKEFHDMCHALTDIGITPDQQEYLFQLLAGILWLGNISFAVDNSDVSVDASSLIKDEACDMVCKLLGFKYEQVNNALTSKVIQAPGETVIMKLTKEQAYDCRDALAKALYAALFDWIVMRINQKLDAGKSKQGSGLSIAILDIYGFEHFQINSFEQLCINYANERLQQQFTRHLFSLEQEEYEREGIDWTKVEFIDNQACVDVIESTNPKKLGVLAVLDSQCKFPKATDESFVQKLKEFITSDHFSIVARRRNEFSVMHYAGEVNYSGDGFLDKNKDTLNGDLVKLLCGADMSVNQLVPLLGCNIDDEMNTNAKKGSTVGSKFSQQLKDLIAELDTTGLHFVRCIKPNSKLAPGLWEEAMVLQQLRCCGVLEVARVARAGYPTRYTHQAFAERYAILLPPNEQAAILEAAKRPETLGDKGALDACHKLLAIFNLDKDQYQIGRTKVFFRPGVLGFVEDKWAAMQNSVLKIQAAWRMYSDKKRYWAMRRSAAVLQSGWRARGDRLHFALVRAEHHAAIALQTAWRCHYWRQDFLRQQHYAMVIQMGYRRYCFNRRVAFRVAEREAKELAIRIEQSRFDNIRQQFGLDMDEVREALAAWQSARSKGTDPVSLMSRSYTGRAPAGPDGQDQEQATVAKDTKEMGVTTDPVTIGDSAATVIPALCTSCKKQLFTGRKSNDSNDVGSNRILSPQASASIKATRSVTSPRETAAAAAMAAAGLGPSSSLRRSGSNAGVAAAGVIEPTASTDEGGMPTGPAAKAWFAAAQETKEKLRTAEAEIIRLRNRVTLEESVKKKQAEKRQREKDDLLNQMEVIEKEKEIMEHELDVVKEWAVLARQLLSDSAAGQLPAPPAALKEALDNAPPSGLVAAGSVGVSAASSAPRKTAEAWVMTDPVMFADSAAAGTTARLANGHHAGSKLSTPTTSMPTSPFGHQSSDNSVPHFSPVVSGTFSVHPPAPVPAPAGPQKLQRIVYANRTDGPLGAAAYGNADSAVDPYKPQEAAGPMQRNLDRTYNASMAGSRRPPNPSLNWAEGRYTGAAPGPDVPESRNIGHGVGNQSVVARYAAADGAAAQDTSAPLRRAVPLARAVPAAAAAGGGVAPALTPNLSVRTQRSTARDDCMKLIHEMHSNIGSVMRATRDNLHFILAVAEGREDGGPMDPKDELERIKKRIMAWKQEVKLQIDANKDVVKKVVNQTKDYADGADPLDFLYQVESEFNHFCKESKEDIRNIENAMTRLVRPGIGSLGVPAGPGAGYDYRQPAALPAQYSADGQHSPPAAHAAARRLQHSSESKKGSFFHRMLGKQ